MDEIILTKEQLYEKRSYEALEAELWRELNNPYVNFFDKQTMKLLTQEEKEKRVKNLVEKIRDYKIVYNKVIEYNDEIDKIIKQINKLKKWEEFVLFDDKHYGIHNIHNNIHRENNCFGNIIPDYIEETIIKCECSSCENWGGCGSNGAKNIIQYYKCDNCNYKYDKMVKTFYNDNYK